MSNRNTKRPLWIGVGIAAGLLVIGIVLPRPRPTQPDSPVGSEPPTAARRGAPANTTPVAAAPVAAATRPPALVSPAAVTPVAGTGGAAAMLRIKAGAVLATVNGIPVELKDLLPLPPGRETAEQTMSAERYAFLLDRAVDREVTLQNARAQSVDLTESQRQQLAGLRARREQSPANGFDDLQHNPANADFETRDATALLLQAALAEKAGVPSRDVTAERVQNYYQAHQAEFAALPSDAAGKPAAWAKIDQAIRLKLAPQFQAEHQEQFQKFMQQLKAAAQITTAPMGS